MKKLRLALVSALLVSTIVGSTLTILFIKPSIAQGAFSLFDYRAKWICNTAVGGSAGTFINSWGSSGSATGQFNTPIGIAVDSSGNAVYVADTFNNRIQKFSSTGGFITTWGSLGSGTGQFNAPEGVAVDPSGNVYVADSSNNRVQKFTSTGVFITTWGSLGSGNGQLNSPVQLAVDSSGNVYVADDDNDRVQKFTSTGVFVTTWGSFGSGNGQFFFPEGVAVDSSGNVYVTDSNNHRVQKFTSNGVFITTWGSFGSGNGQFDQPELVAVDSSGNVYVVDELNNRVQKFSSTGSFIATWGSPGSAASQFDNPVGVGVDSLGNVYVADSYNNRVQVFASLVPSDAERIGLVPGEYKTDINVHNPSHSVTIFNILKQFVVSVPEPLSGGSVSTVTAASAIVASIVPGGALFIDCRDIAAVFLQKGITIPNAAKGFLAMTASSANLDVVAEYSSESFNSTFVTPATVSTGISLDIIQIASTPFVK